VHILDAVTIKSRQNIVRGTSLTVEVAGRLLVHTDSIKLADIDIDNAVFMSRFCFTEHSLL